jgi:hypothetical protein
MDIDILILQNTLITGLFLPPIHRKRMVHSPGFAWCRIQ